MFEHGRLGWLAAGRISRVLSPLDSLLLIPSGAMSKLRCIIYVVYRFVFNRLRRVFLHRLLRRARRTLPVIKKVDVFRLTERTVLKCGPPEPIFSEAANLRFVARHTSVPVPQVYDVWQESSGKAYLVMEFIPGQELRRAWKDLPSEQQVDLLCSLRGYVEQLRGIPQPGRRGWIGPADGAPLSDTLLSLNGLYGPFATEAALNDWRVRTFDYIAQRDPSGSVARQLRRIRADMPDDHQITFTHGDLNRRNIIVRSGEEGARIAAIIDWTQSGWRPEYWELRKFHDVESGPWAERVLNTVFVERYEDEIQRDFELCLVAGAPRDRDLSAHCFWPVFFADGLRQERGCAESSLDGCYWLGFLRTIPLLLGPMRRLWLAMASEEI